MKRLWLLARSLALPCLAGLLLLPKADALAADADAVESRSAAGLYREANGEPLESGGVALAAVPELALAPAAVVLQEQHISSAGIAGGDFFGWSVAISGDTAIVGAWLDDERGRDAGAAYVFIRRNDAWSAQAKLMATDAIAGDYFGAAVALDGDRALIGAPLGGDDAYFAGDAGAAYLFERRGTDWIQVQKLTPAQAASGDLFGRALALDGETALIGAYGDRDNGVNSGAAYVFTRSDQGWVEQAKLKANDGHTDDRFGASVALDGDRLLIGAYRHDDRGIDAGAAYLFKRGEEGWQQQAKLTAQDGVDLAFFGFSVALAGETALIGAWRDNEQAPDAGAAYLFQRGKRGWQQQEKLRGKIDQGRFGYAVALQARRALIGAYRDDSLDAASGAAYLFERDQRRWRRRAVLGGERLDAGFGISVALDGDTLVVGAVLDEVGLNPGVAQAFVPGAQGWRLQGRLSTPEAAIGDRFGAAVALSDAYALIGAPKARTQQAELAGAAYLFQRDPLGLGQHHSLLAADAEIGDGFGRAVAISGEQLLIGAPAATVAGDQAGLAYLYRHADGEWRQDARLSGGDGGVRAAFGQTLALAGERALIGAPGDQEAGSGAGAAHVFVRRKQGWEREAKLFAADPSLDAQFGSALALTGDRALIGAYRDNERGRLAGAAYLFERGDQGWRQVQKLMALDARAGQYFGYAVALAEDWALIGAWGDDDQGSNAGAVYLFERTESRWLQRQKLMPASAGARLGISVALVDDSALAGAYFDDEQAQRLGSAAKLGGAYLFRHAGNAWRLLTAVRAGPANPSYGMRVALASDAALIGTSQADESGRVAFFRFALGQGSDADLFARDAEGTAARVAEDLPAE